MKAVPIIAILFSLLFVASCSKEETFNAAEWTR